MRKILTLFLIISFLSISSEIKDNYLKNFAKLYTKIIAESKDFEIKKSNQKFENKKYEKKEEIVEKEKIETNKEEKLALKVIKSLEANDKLLQKENKNFIEKTQNLEQKILQKPKQENSKPDIQEEIIIQKFNKLQEFFIKEDIKVYSDENKNNSKGSLKKGTRVFLNDKKEIEKIIKNKNGSIKQRIEMVQVVYKDIGKEKTVWLESRFLTDKRKNILPEKINDVEISTKVKKEYLENPRVKVKGIYVTAKTLALERRLNELLKLSKENGINAFIIDVKGDFGEITFRISQDVKKYSKNSNKKVDIKNIEPIIKKLKENGIYTIARIVSFKDPTYAKENPDKVISYKKNGEAFSNKDGLVWVSPHDRNLWEYNVFVAKEAAKAGFNEIQFDYVRFPASNGGKLDSVLDYKNIEKESKARVIQKYLEYAKKELEPFKVYISADVYGQIGTAKDDMSLGQYWEAVSSEVDYISPMIYPSHYGKGVYGLSIPDANPYKTVYYSTKDSINRNNNIDNPAIIRPWIQAFTAKWVKGHIKYGANEVHEQVKAMKDLGIDEYILWSPTNRYERYF